jgi:hypothetical protein
MRFKEDCQRFEELANSVEEYRTIAMKYWREGDLDRAVRILESGYARYGDISFLQSMGDIRREQGICKEARRHYARYIAAAPPEIPKEWLDKVRSFGEPPTCKPTD